MKKFGITVVKVGPHHYGNWTCDGEPVRLGPDSTVESITPIPGQHIFDTTPIEANELDASIQDRLKKSVREEARRRKIAEDVTP